ncbi:LytTR family DNA-binding domain-containing protein [Paenibacillus sp. BR2-3]|uniref:LytTR family DNA-binding domain-containing protein n=1 Tax=Paenibacillus sp. BR2-3 TaxID=3048494 RepID=UPI00397781DB
MATITVTRDPAGISGIFSINVDEILMLEYSRREDRIVVHTEDNSFFTVGTLKYWTDALNGSGHKFAMVDRGNSLNLEKVVRIDETFNVAYFEDAIDSNSKRCMIARHRIKEVKNALDIINPAVIVTY